MASTTTVAAGLVPSLLSITGRLLVDSHDSHDNPVQPPPVLASPKGHHRGVPFLPDSDQSSNGTPPSSKLESLPVEILDQILFHLIHPCCRLPGLTEAQSRYDVSEQQKRSIKNQEDLTQTPDSHRWAADIFSLHLLSHPFNALSITSRRCNGFVEGFCSHLVRQCNMFNLPFAQLDMCGVVYPDLSHIVHRRLWLQHAPRRCIYCSAVLDNYPFPLVKRVITACEGCFYRQTLTVDEVQMQYHISAATVLSSRNVRGNMDSVWILRVDVEELALQLYRTREFHSARKEQLGKPCNLCAITRFRPEHHIGKPRPTQKAAVRLIAKKRSTRRSNRS
ncbi:hypothetical protein G6011_09733 [Alternaria panax]|uniref:Uncharacterized protein n=1 Tax=Alternaria panax TaxID=48097 RepID=A0AAD4FB21_9PLEO|nr:hypothetical protein G6011_09733 [Alternaria panax]